MMVNSEKDIKYRKLNKEQYEAVMTTEGSVLILAGAGSGKTTVIVNRIAHLIIDLNVNPYEILAITFTNKAADEMRTRVDKLVGKRTERMWISTFHSSCVRILRREIDKIGYNKNFAIYDSYDQKALVKQCMEELNISNRDISDKEIINTIGRQKDNLIDADKFKKENESDYKMNRIADVYLLYQKKLKNNNALDFDDLIYKTIELFKKNPEVLSFYQKKFKYVMVDEYQDTNKSQYEFVRLLTLNNSNLCVVGDDDQCIYEWRGADISNILNFEHDFPNTKVVKLEQNYRSKGNILKAANAVIRNNSQRKSKQLRTTNDTGEKVKVYRAYSDNAEGDFVSSEVLRIVKNEKRDYRDFAVLYRTNAQSRIFEEAFMKWGIPYRMVGGLKFYDRKEIKDMLAYLKLINNPLDDISLKRIINVPKRNIGSATLQKVQDAADSIDECLYSTLLNVNDIPNLTTRNITSLTKFISLLNSFVKIRDMISVSKLIEEVLSSSGYLDELKNSNDVEDISRIENLKELVSAAVDFENSSEDKSLSAFLEKIALVTDVDNYDENAEGVVLMTLHSAKGLEFPVVFMVGMENGIFPGISSLNNPREMEESRRLCYVGITRAKEKLYMSSARFRRVFGRTVAYEESSFISEIPDELKEDLGNTEKSSDASAAVSVTSDGEEVERRTLSAKDVTLGRKVRHNKFGVGTIIKITKEDSYTKLTIAFDYMGVKTLMLNVAPLEVVD